MAEPIPTNNAAICNGTNYGAGFNEPEIAKQVNYYNQNFCLSYFLRLQKDAQNDIFNMIKNNYK